MKNESILLEKWNNLMSGQLQRLPALLLLITVVFFLGGCSALQSQNNGNSNLDKQIALQQMEQELLSEPKEVEKRSAADFEQLGDRYILKGDINRAYLYYVKGLGVAPDKVSLLHKQGSLLIKKNKYSAAEPIYKRLLALNGNDAVAHEGLGKIYFAQGKSVEAEPAFLAALGTNPALWQAHEFLGLIESQRQDFPKAIKHFKAALAEKPGRLSISNNLAVTYYLNGDFDDAVRILRELPASTNRKIYNNLALTYFQLGHYEKAMAAFRKGTEYEAVAYNNMGSEYLSVQKYHEAIEAFKEAIDRHPKFYLSAQKNLNRAQDELSKALVKTEN
jgi:tetratricopeptide (TPR) repeat protein